MAVGIPTIAALMLAVMLWRVAAAPPPRTVARLSLNFPPGVTLFIPANGTSFAIAPDGSRLAFLGVRDGRAVALHSPLDTGKPLDVADTRDAVNPIFSPDSQWVAFGQAGSIKKVPAAGGPVEVVAADGAAGPMAWLSDGRFVLRNMSGSPMRQILPVVPDDQTISRLPRANKATSRLC